MLELNSIAVHRGGAVAVRDVSLQVAAGAWFGVIGANGSGKTSLLRAVAGRLPLSGGHIRIDGEDRTAEREARARAIGFAPDMAMLPRALTPRGVLALVAGDADAGLHALGNLTEPLGLTPLLDRRMGWFSAGQRQRVAIACAFAAGQGLVILDEPFNWLDPVAAYDLRAALRARVDAGLTLVTALHDLPTLAATCDAGALLAEGRVARRIDSAALTAARADPAAFEAETIAQLRGQAANVPASTA